MTHSYVNNLVHVVFGTLDRRPIIDPAWRQRLHTMMGGIARHRGFPALAIGGVADHVHALLVVPSDTSLAKVMQVFKAVSSKWINETINPEIHFAWQGGYGGFSVGISQRDATMAYIAHQEEHHRHRGFREEFDDFLARHGMPFDPHDVWDSAAPAGLGSG
jgi:REP element-mobilizing transposase RayT